jgi:hypothetical protein
MPGPVPEQFVDFPHERAGARQVRESADVFEVSG